VVVVVIRCHGGPKRPASTVTLIAEKPRAWITAKASAALAAMVTLADRKWSKAVDALAQW
jgi:hypothetical protein